MKRTKTIAGMVLVALVLVSGFAIAGGRELLESQHIVMAIPYGTDPGGGEDYVSLKNWGHAFILIAGTNGATLTTGTVVTVKQATAVAGTSEKALSYTAYYVCTNSVVSDTWTRTAVGGSCTSPVSGSDMWLIGIDVEASDLDVANNFDCIRVDVTGSTAQDLGGVYILNAGRFVGDTPTVSAIVD